MIKHNIMEPKSIQFRHPELEESFSFTSCRDFNSSSSFSFFSDSDGGGEDDESYIEIAFERPDRFNKDDEMELRISFSSLSAETKASLSSSNSSSLSTFTFSSSFTESQRSREAQSTEEAGCDFRVEKTVKGKVQFPVANRLVNTFVSSFRLSPEVNVGDAETQSPAANHLEIIPSSYSTKRRSKITTTTTINASGMMMNFFVKFRALKLKTLLASFLKASQTNPAGRKPEDRSIIKYWNRVKPADKGLEKEKKLNLEGIKGYMLEVMSSINRNATTKSCPVSTESSPLHQRFLSESYKICASDNSIQAAIAHCKKSFGPNV